MGPDNDPESIYPTTNAFFHHGDNVRSLTLHPVVLLPNNTIHGAFHYGKLQPPTVSSLEEHLMLECAAAAADALVSLEA